MDIKNIYDAVIFTSAARSIKNAMVEAVSKRADLREVENAELVIARLQFIPTEGAFIGWKKCRKGVLVKLSIPDDAKRSHGSERKCRASHVDCLEVIGADEGVSINTESVIYRKGERVTADSFNEDRWTTCSHGIHFYLTREEAEAHQ